jgi:phospholipid transport system substrate-binding protein
MWSYFILPGNFSSGLDKKAAMNKYLTSTIKSYTGLIASCLIGAMVLSAPPVQASDQAAVAVVEELHGMLVDNMKSAPGRDYPERYRLLEPFIENRFDLPLIVKVILSRYWNKFSEEQRTHFIELFKNLTVATYASRFNSYDNEEFITNSVEKLQKGRLLVKTEILAGNEKPVSLDYLMHENDGKWQIISVVANGINDLSLKRAEYGTIIKDEGYESLVRQLQEKIAQYELSG